MYDQPNVGGGLGGACAVEELQAVTLARRVARLNSEEMQVFGRAFEKLRSEVERDSPGKAVQAKEAEAPGVQKWLVLTGERTQELFQEIYILENELRPLLRPLPGGDNASTTAPEPFLVVDHLALHHNALAIAASLIRNLRQRLQL